MRIARDLISKRISAIEAARCLVSFAHADSALLSQEDLNTLLGVASEKDDLPLGVVRREWLPEALVEKDRQIAQCEENYGPEVRAICERLLQEHNPAITYVGSPDFHDGFVRAVLHVDDEACVTVEGDTGKEYVVCFHGVTNVEMSSPEDMELYALSEAPTDVDGVKRYDFINWYCDEPGRPESEAYLRIFAANFSLNAIEI